MKVLDNQQRAKSITLVFKIFIGIYVLSAISNLLQYNLLSSDLTIILNEGRSNDLRQGIVAILIIICLITSAILYIQWSRRAYHNINRAGMKTEFSEGWASGAWFVPFLNLVRPYKILRETWDKTSRYISEHEEVRQKETNKVFNMIGWWWALFIISGVVENISTQIANNAMSIEKFQVSTVMSIVSDIANIGCLILIVMIIPKVAKREAILMQVWRKEKASEGAFNISDSQEILD